MKNIIVSCLLTFMVAVPSLGLTENCSNEIKNIKKQLRSLSNQLQPKLHSISVQQTRFNYHVGQFRQYQNSIIPERANIQNAYNQYRGLLVELSIVNNDLMVLQNYQQTPNVVYNTSQRIQYRSQLLQRKNQLRSYLINARTILHNKIVNLESIKNALDREHHDLSELIGQANTMRSQFTSLMEKIHYFHTPEGRVACAAANVQAIENQNRQKLQTLNQLDQIQERASQTQQEAESLKNELDQFFAQINQATQ